MKEQAAMKKRHKWHQKRSLWVLFVLSIIYISTIFYHQQKPLPKGINYKGNIHHLTDSEIEFLYDLTYQKNGKEIHEQEIFEEVYQTIENAEEFLILDFFMMNETSAIGRDFPPISRTIRQKIMKQKEKYPDLEIIFITDPINTTYGSHKAQHIEPLSQIGAEVIYTDLNRLRDPNPLYSGFWRMFVKWFGQEGTGWITNPFGNKSPNVTARSYLKLLNIKANHRKVVISEDNGLILSGNPHDASGFHSNVGFKVKGAILKDLIESEQAVAAFSGGNTSLFPTEKELDTLLETTTSSKKDAIQAQIVTEKQTEKRVIQVIKDTTAEDEIWIGMFYLADRTIIDSLKDAADRGASIRIILDPNQNAFGNEKVGLPNIPVASELQNDHSENITIRWYNINKEQYHSKIFYVHGQDTSEIVIGSSNFTARNLNNYNLESNLSISSANHQKVVQEVDQYFRIIWNNEDAVYTLAYKEYADSINIVRKIGYTLQKFTMFTTY